MTCQNLEENLPLLLYGELSSQELAACQEHLAECAHCRAERDKLEQFHQLLARRPPSPRSRAGTRSRPVCPPLRRGALPR